MEAIKIAGLLLAGAVIGYDVEVFNVSVIAHEAEKGNPEFQKTMHEFEQIGSRIEEFMTGKHNS